MKTLSDQDIKFLLKNPTADRPTLISLYYRYTNKRFVYSTGLTVEPSQWDVHQQRAYTNQRSRIARKPFENINAELDRYRSILIGILTRLQMVGAQYDNVTIKQFFDAETGRLPKEQPKPVEVAAEPFTAYIERFVEEARAQVDTLH